MWILNIKLNVKLQKWDHLKLFSIKSNPFTDYFQHFTFKIRTHAGLNDSRNNWRPNKWNKKKLKWQWRAWQKEKIKLLGNNRLIFSLFQNLFSRHSFFIIVLTHYVTFISDAMDKKNLNVPCRSHWKVSCFITYCEEWNSCRILWRLDRRSEVCHRHGRYEKFHKSVSAESWLNRRKLKKNSTHWKISHFSFCLFHFFITQVLRSEWAFS